MESVFVGLRQVREDYQSRHYGSGRANKRRTVFDGNLVVACVAESKFRDISQIAKQFSPKTDAG